MKNLLLIPALLLSLCSSAQISFVDPGTSWEQLSKNAARDKKLIFIHLEGSECEQCNEVATKGFEGVILKKTFEKDFISIRTNVASDNGRKLAEKFRIRGALVSLYVDADGNILNRYNGSTSNSKMYLDNAEVAISRRGAKQITQFDKEYKNGERSAAFLKAYIQKRKEAQIPAGDLLDEYIGRLPVDSLSTFQTVKFIYQQGPTLDSRVYKIIQAIVPQKMIDSMYKSVPLNEAIAFNNGIIGNTIQKAVDKKDRQLAYQAAFFTQQTHKNNFGTGRLSYSRNMLSYYLRTNDTTTYFSEARQFINQTHLVITVDSLKRMDDAAFKKNLAAQTPMGPAGEKQMVQFSPPSQGFHIELNEHAWNFYRMNNDPRDLETALMWSKRSMEWFDELRKDKHHMPLGNPAYIDTYAHLLYKLGRKPESIEWQTKAVEAQKVTGMSWASMEKDLNEMKNGTLKR